MYVRMWFYCIVCVLFSLSVCTHMQYTYVCTVCVYRWQDFFYGKMATWYWIKRIILGNWFVDLLKICQIANLNSSPKILLIRYFVIAYTAEGCNIKHVIKFYIL